VSSGGVSSVEVASCGMFPTFGPGDRLQFDPAVGDIRRGDIVSYRVAVPGEPEPRVMVHRVVGLPGERLEPAPDGRVLLNGAALTEDYLPPGTKTHLTEAVDIPAGRYFLIGDNRRYSSDSRVGGPIPASDIVATVGKVVEGKGGDDEDCPVADPSEPDPATRPPLTVSEKDPPRAQIFMLSIIVETAANQKVAGDNLEAVRTEVRNHTDRLAELLGQVAPDGDNEAERVVRNEIVPALRAMIAAATVDEWTARLDGLAAAKNHHLQAVQADVLGH
jgi:signal peptidase I